MAAVGSEADAILRRAAWRLVPLILAIYVAASPSTASMASALPP